MSNTWGNAPKPTIMVKSPSGGRIEVLTVEEKTWYEDRASKYMADGHYTFVSDLQELDRILNMELNAWRLGLWLLKDEDYFGDPIERDQVQKAVNDISKEIRQIKKAMGMEKVQRDKEKGSSISDRWDDLCARAEEFGIMREKQLTEAITLFMDLKALMTFHLNCDEQERKENDVEEHDVIQWIIDVAIPQFDKIDEYFRENQQRFWVGTL